MIQQGLSWLPAEVQECVLQGLVAKDEKDPELAKKQINALTLTKTS